MLRFVLSLVAVIAILVAANVGWAQPRGPLVKATVEPKCSVAPKSKSNVVVVLHSLTYGSYGSAINFTFDTGNIVGVPGQQTQRFWVAPGQRTLQIFLTGANPPSSPLYTFKAPTCVAIPNRGIELPREK